MPKIIFIDKANQAREMSAEIGQTLLQVAWAYGLDVEGACEGNLACSTCHLIADPAWYGKLSPASLDETDMLDLASGVTKTSRLGCQIKVTEVLDGLVVRLPG